MPNNPFHESKMYWIFGESKRPDCGVSLWRSGDVCAGEPPRGKPRASLNSDSLQNLQIRALKRELASVKELVQILMKAADPEDVAATLRLQTRTPSTQRLLAIGKRGGRPPQIGDEPQDNL